MCVCMCVCIVVTDKEKGVTDRNRRDERSSICLHRDILM